MFELVLEKAEEPEIMEVSFFSMIQVKKERNLP